MPIHSLSFFVTENYLYFVPTLLTMSVILDSHLFSLSISRTKRHCHLSSLLLVRSLLSFQMSFLCSNPAFLSEVSFFLTSCRFTSVQCGFICIFPAQQSEGSLDLVTLILLIFEYSQFLFLLEQHQNSVTPFSVS